MKPFRSPGGSEWSLLRQRVDALGLSKQIYLLLAVPAIVIVVIVLSGRSEKQPEWDTGYLDHVDQELFRKALDAKSSAMLNSASPKIAFLFLVRGPLPLEETWDRFLKGSEDKYSIYIHSSIPGFDVDASTNFSAFSGRQIPSVPITWGGPNMIRAERRLLAAALADPLNQRFVLLSESCLPLFNFSHVYDYLFSTESSFITSHESAWRYKAGLAPLVRKEEFRKGSQWFAITRPHAHLVIADTLYYDQFVQTGAEIPDESYMQTILPKLDPTHVEPRSVSYVHWQFSSSRHPMLYKEADVTKEFIQGLQESRLPPEETTGFMKVSHSKPCQVNGQPRHCFLFARKFSTSAQRSFVRLHDIVGY